MSRASGPQSQHHVNGIDAEDYASTEHTTSTLRYWADKSLPTLASKGWKDKMRGCDDTKMCRKPRVSKGDHTRASADKTDDKTEQAVRKKAVYCQAVRCSDKGRPPECAHEEVQEEDPPTNSHCASLEQSPTGTRYRQDYFSEQSATDSTSGVSDCDSTALNDTDVLKSTSLFTRNKEDFCATHELRKTPSSLSSDERKSGKGHVVTQRTTRRSKGDTRLHFTSTDSREKQRPDAALLDSTRKRLHATKTDPKHVSHRSSPTAASRENSEMDNPCTTGETGQKQYYTTSADAKEKSHSDPSKTPPISYGQKGLDTSHRERGTQRTQNQDKKKSYKQPRPDTRNGNAGSKTKVREEHKEHKEHTDRTRTRQTENSSRTDKRHGEGTDRTQTSHKGNTNQTPTQHTEDSDRKHTRRQEDTKRTGTGQVKDMNKTPTGDEKGGDRREQLQAPSPPHLPSEELVSTLYFKEEMRRYVAGQYPGFQERCYIVPPVHFNVSKRSEIPDMPGYQTAAETPHSNTRADEAQGRFLGVLQEVLMGHTVFVLPGITFEECLNKRIPLNPSQPDKLMQIPLPKSADLPLKYRRGEVDVLIIHKAHGILIVDVKAVGDTFQELGVSESEALDVVSKVLEKALLLMIKAKDVLLHLVGDIPATIPVSVMLVLPNLSRDLLQKTLDSNPKLCKALRGCMMAKLPLTETCLCAEDLPSKHQTPTDTDVKHLADWWNRHYPKKSPTIEDEIYEDIIGRFCGPYSTNTVWTAQHPRKEIQTVGQAVNETGERFATLLPLPQQLEVRNSKDRLVYLAGPPGSGKTQVLILKGVQWLREGDHVCVLTAKAGPSPVALVIVKQIQKALEQYHDDVSGHVETETILEDTDGLRTDGSKLVKRLRARAKGRTICFIVDEIHGEVIPSILALCQQIPDCRFWCSGTWPSNCPPKFVLKELPIPIRCPPAVQSVLKMTEPLWTLSSECEPLRPQYRYVTSSTEVSQYPLPTSGVQVKLLSHAGHGPQPILQCVQCAEALVTYLRKELKIGEDIQTGEVMILSADTNTLHQGFLPSKFVQVFERHGLVLDVIEDISGSQEKLAFPSKITLTSHRFMTGLERKVVAFLPGGTSSDNSNADVCVGQTCSKDREINMGLFAEKPPKPTQNTLQGTIATLRYPATGSEMPPIAFEGRSWEQEENDSEHQAVMLEMEKHEAGNESVTDITSAACCDSKKGDFSQENKQDNFENRQEVCEENRQEVCLENRKEAVCGPSKKVVTASEHTMLTLTSSKTRGGCRDEYRRPIVSLGDSNEDFLQDLDRDAHHDEENECSSDNDIIVSIENDSDEDGSSGFYSDVSSEAEPSTTEESVSHTLMRSLSGNYVENTRVRTKMHPPCTEMKVGDSKIHVKTDSAVDHSSKVTVTDDNALLSIHPGSRDILLHPLEMDNCTPSSLSHPNDVQVSTTDDDTVSTVDTTCTEGVDREDVEQSLEHASAVNEGQGPDNVAVRIQSYDSRLRAAVQSLSIANRETLWYSASRCLGQLVVFHF